MSDRILVTGATGLQGGAVARHLLKLGKPEVRCLTRRPDSEAAKTFKQLGAEVEKLTWMILPASSRYREAARAFSASLIFGKPFCENTTRV